MKCKIKKPDVQDILTILLFLSCFSNRYLEMHIEYYSLIRIMLSICSTAVVLVDAFFVQHKICFSKTTIYVLIFFLVISFSTVLNAGNLQRPVKEFYKIFLLLMYLDINRDRDIDRILNTLSTLIFLLALIDVITELIFPMGMYTYRYANNWFLGYKTDRIQYTLPACMIRVYLDYVQHGKIEKLTFGYIFFMMINIVLSQTTMGGIVFLFLFFMLLISSSQRLSQKKWIAQLYGLLLGSKFIITVYVIITFLLVFIQKITPFIGIFTFFGKTVTMSGRLGIWTRALNLIKEKPLLGYGFQTMDLSHELINFSNAHNIVVAVLMNGGLILLIVHISMLIYGIKMTGKIQFGNSMVIFIYAYIILGISSANFIFSPFAMFLFWLIEYAVYQRTIVECNSAKKLMKESGICYE